MFSKVKLLKHFYIIQICQIFSIILIFIGFVTFEILHQFQRYQFFSCLKLKGRREDGGHM